MYVGIATKVPLGIFLKGEQSYDEMVEVLDHMHQYIPTVSTVGEVSVTADSQQRVEVVTDRVHPIALGMSWLCLSDTNVHLMTAFFYRW